ncbi:MAG TPA: HNH endonuclease family protein, partial [Gemmataceae bacterium]|nr:HNH endonuclease family protein [Gemmataceae bacterium]
KSHLARYYLRSLERTRRGDNQPELIVNDDQTEITLEHILPENPAGKWGRIDQSMAEPVYRRLGNMVLLRMSVNSVIGNVTFEEKKKAYEKSAQSLLLTQDVTTYPDWNLDMINLRQAELAKLAAKTWPITPPR